MSISQEILTGATTTVSSGWVHINAFAACIQAWLADTTTPAATLIIEGSNEDVPTHPVALATVELSGALNTNGYSTAAGYYWLRVRISAISGTSAAVTANIRGFE